MSITLSDEELLYLYKHIKPIVSIDEAKYVLRKFSLNELKYRSYIAYAEKNIENKVGDLVPVEEFICLHDHNSYPVPFRPSVSDVLSQLPARSLREANYFEIVDSSLNSEFHYEQMCKFIKEHKSFEDHTYSKVKTYIEKNNYKRKLY